MQKEDNHDAQNERAGAKDKFKQAAGHGASSSKDKFDNLTGGGQHIVPSEAERQANLDAMRQKIEQAKHDTAVAWQQAQQQAQLEEQKTLELKRLRQAELAQQQAAASYDSSGDDDSGSEALSTFGTVLMGVAQGVAAANGQNLNVLNFNAYGSDSNYSGSGGHCPQGYNFHPGGPYTKRGCFSIETRKWAFPAQ